jgi:alpha-L-fucosidase
VTASIVRLEEDIEKSQMVARYTVSGSDADPWRGLSQGTTIGYARIDRFEPVSVRRVRLVIEEAVATPEPIRIKLY